LGFSLSSFGAGFLADCAGLFDFITTVWDNLSFSLSLNFSFDFDFDFGVPGFSFSFLLFLFVGFNSLAKWFSSSTIIIKRIFIILFITYILLLLFREGILFHPIIFGQYHL
jgi:hypothetical protein